MNNLFTNRPWAATIEAISAAAKAAARAPGEQEPTSAPTAIRTPAGTIIVPITGLLVKAEREAAGLRAFGIDSTAYSEISDLLADTTGPVVLAINSLGGMLSGLEKCANAIYSARPRILAAAIEGAGASAAYVLAAAAGCKIYADADALVGAAGVVVQGTGGGRDGGHPERLQACRPPPGRAGNGRLVRGQTLQDHRARPGGHLQGGRRPTGTRREPGIQQIFD